MRLLIFSKTKKPTPWLIGLVTVGLLGTTTTAYLLGQRNTLKANNSNLTVAVESKDLRVQIKANGTLQPIRKINLSPKDSGQIAKLYVDEGDKVKQGQLIARMDSEQFQAQVDQYKAAVAKATADLAQKRTGNRPQEIAKAQAEVTKNQAQVTEARSRLALASLQVRRKQSPTQQGAISRDELDKALTEERNARDNLKQTEANLTVATQELTLQRQGYRQEEIAQAEAEVAQTKAQLQYYETQLKNTLIRAPFAGTITRRFAQEGDFVTPTTSASASDGATSTSVAELSSGLEVEAKVPEASMSRIKLGQDVEIRSDTYPDDIFEGNVRLIAPTAIQESQQNHNATSNVTSFRVKVILRTGKDKLKSGMNVKLSFKGDSLHNVLVVPLAAIITKKDGQTGVLVFDENNQAKFRPVSVGFTSGDKIQIINGVSKGERILMNPPDSQSIPGVDTLGL
ncbi:MAG: efflux RND transporter periplasmic adaptor subunit [Fischerella sp. CENA71]|nr:efflux RND transporter periplasmic adaptor subunit [Fischerella sp. CENA71]